MNIEQLVRKNVRAMMPYSSARDEFKEAADVYLDANESPFENGVNRYPDPHQKVLKEKLAQIKKTNPGNIVLGNGSDEIIDLLIRAFCEPGIDHIITTPPTYGIYKVFAELNNVENKEVLLNADFSLNVPSIIGAINTNTKIIFLCSPNNPSGNLLAQEDIETILGATGGIVVIDEAYIDYAADKSWVKRINEFPNIIVMQTLSKARGMAGLRLGICIASTDVVALLQKIKPPYNVNQLSQEKALEILMREDEFNSQVKYINEQKTLLQLELESLTSVKNVFPSHANFLLVRVTDAESIYKFLLQKGIVTRNRSNQPLCNNCLRITIGLKEENEKLIEALKEIQL